MRNKMWKLKLQTQSISKNLLPYFYTFHIFLDYDSNDVRT